MRIAVVADVHVGNHQRGGGAPRSGVNARARLVLGSLREAVALANEKEARYLVVAGDLFDYQRPEPQLIAEVQAILREFLGTTYVLVGNHDQVSDQPGDHALGPLRPVATIIETPTLVSSQGVELLLLPFLPTDRPAQEAIAEALTAFQPPLEGRTRALFLHAGLRDEKTAPWLREARDAVDVRALATMAKGVGASMVFAGNWHDRRSWSVDGVCLVQLGALVPTGFDNPGLEGYGTVAVWEPPAPRATLHEVGGPRFVKAEPGQLPLFEEEARERGFELFVELSAADLTEARELREGAKASDSTTRLDVVIDREPARVRAKMAGTAARRADTLDGAVRGYVARMDVFGADREEVASLALEYLKKGRGA